MSLGDRSDALVSLLADLQESDLSYVLVGGYAVSVFNARFSTDLDIVAPPDAVDEFVEFLAERGFEQTDSHSKHWIYDTEVREFEKRLAPRQPIGFDLLVNGLGCRQTEAQWSFEYLSEHSHRREISGGTMTTSANVVDGTVLVATKLHSGRETDLRDVLAVAEEVRLEAVTPHLHRGDEQARKEQLERGKEVLASDGLRHGYRSDFGESSISTGTVTSLREYLTEQIERLG